VAAQPVDRVRRVLSLLLGALGVPIYNWWITVPFIPGLLRSPNGFFSDVEASGLRDSRYFQHADILSGILWFFALIVRGRHGRDGTPREEWPWYLAFTCFATLGGVFVYACPEGASAVCRNLEWHFKLPLHHYVHAIAGVAEFATASVALVIATRRSAKAAARTARTYRALLIVLLVSYPLLGVAYLTDRLGAIVEPIFFLLFTVVISLELIEPRMATAETRPNAVDAVSPGQALSRRGDGAPLRAEE